MKENNSKFICNWCGRPSSIIWVHGHGQCALCGTNIEECCRGEVCELPGTPEVEDRSKNDEQ